MMGAVGDAIDEPYFFWNHPGFRHTRGEVIKLPNGNTEFQMRWGKECNVYFEADARSNRIIGARFEGTRRTCYHVS